LRWGRRRVRRLRRRRGLPCGSGYCGGDVCRLGHIAKVGDRVASEDARVPAEIKADVETFARALVKYSATYADEDLGSPPEALGIELGAALTDNDLERFWYAVDSMDREERTLERLDAWALENCPPPYP
jgi:hypothetical protein